MSAKDLIPILQDTIFVYRIVGDNLAQFAGAALLYYDYLLTVSDEVRLVWKSRINLAGVLYLAIRYASIADATLVIIASAPQYDLDSNFLGHNRCQIFFDASTVMHVIYTVAVSAFVALRIMALWSRNWLLGISLFVAGLLNSTPVVQVIYMAGFQAVPAPWPMPGCVEITDSDMFLDLAGQVAFHVLWYAGLWGVDVNTPLIRTSAPIVTSAINMAYELICLVLTVIKTFRLYRHLSFSLRSQTRLSGLLLRDGSLYFAVMIILGVVNIVSVTAPDSTFPGGGINEAFGRTLVVVLTTRFISNLRRTETWTTGFMSSAQGRSTMRFATKTERFLQPMDGSLAVFDDDLEEAE
ncbi:hypothetical protein C8Q78DRAFT_1078207 [Trametes maxima]|nr:hypothetical protein C8Q78DRAFT_1078207 [Trametes maxima]